MAILKDQSITFVGKLGAIVGEYYQGIYRARAWAMPKNPRSSAQQYDRGRFAYAVTLAQLAYEANRRAPAWGVNPFGEFGKRCGTATSRLIADATLYEALPIFPTDYVPTYSIADFATGTAPAVDPVDQQTLYTERLRNVNATHAATSQLELTGDISVRDTTIFYSPTPASIGIVSPTAAALVGTRELFCFLFYTDTATRTEVCDRHLSAVDPDTGALNFDVPDTADLNFPVVLTGCSTEDYLYNDESIFIPTTNLNPTAPIQWAERLEQWQLYISSKALTTGNLVTQ